MIEKTDFIYTFSVYTLVIFVTQFIKFNHTGFLLIKDWITVPEIQFK